ncbi:MAG: hypothetical protein CMP76_07990 [Flavobacterium sp.]|uniref:hypothetical protein n=1 Tax=Flavobacterium sp. TaxID=239 RepID=UPI000C3DC8C8|nr:hypothetical protein [Flavobacterium sp.]MBF03221.1 hypothetical protein [Flavobacterium sp.]|tara:strand:+ start:588 stop:1397 length:810 start_codon:yes stop_codon:yes gene_type:complete
MKTGLNGWFGRFLKRAIEKIAEQVDATITSLTFGFVDSNFTEYANSIGSGGGSFWNRTAYDDLLANIENDPRATYEPTPEEEVLLNDFTNEFTPVVTNLAEIASNIANKPLTESKVKIVNELLQRFEVIKQYYKLKEQKGLSREALGLRSLIVEVLLLKIETDIKAEMSKEASLTLISAYTTSPANQVIQELYPLKKIVTEDIWSKFKIYKMQVLDLPPDETDPIDATPIETISTPTETETKRGYGWLVIGTIGFILFKVFGDKEEKKS